MRVSPLPVTPMPDERISLVISARPQPTLADPIDIDVWLSRPAGRKDNKDHTNLAMLEAIGHTRAAHADPDVHPIVEMLEGMHTASSTTGGQQDFFVFVIREIGETLLELAEQLFHKSTQP